MSRLLLSRLTKGLGLLGLGAGSYVGYKTYRKSVSHFPWVEYAGNDEALYDKSVMKYNLKSREDHLKEAQQTEYDILVIG